MLAALLIAGTVLAIPMLYFCVQWARLAREEQSQVRELVEKAAELPSNPSRFTREQAVRAEKILDSAYRLPSVLPSDIPQLSTLWKARQEIQRLVRSGHDSQGQDQEESADAVVVPPDWPNVLNAAYTKWAKLIDEPSSALGRRQVIQELMEVLATTSWSVPEAELESERTPKVKIEKPRDLVPISKHEQSEKSQMRRHLALVG